MLGREPALILGAVNALIALGVGFGVGLDGHQVGVVNAAAAAVLSVIVRHEVTPVHHPVGLDGRRLIPYGPRPNDTQ